MYYWDLHSPLHLLCSCHVSVVVRRMYYWDQCLNFLIFPPQKVSVVVRRMYYWDQETDDHLDQAYEFQ